MEWNKEFPSIHSMHETKLYSHFHWLIASTALIDYMIMNESRKKNTQREREKQRRVFNYGIFRPSIISSKGFKSTIYVSAIELISLRLISFLPHQMNMMHLMRVEHTIAP